MSGTLYRPPQPGSLEDLLYRAQGQAPVATPAPPQAPAVEQEGILTPQEKQQVLAEIFKPYIGEEPKVDKINPIAAALMAIGDAGSTFAGILGGTGSQSRTFDQYLARINQQKAEAREFQQRKGEAELRGKQGKAQYLLSQDERARDQRLRTKETAAERAAREKERLEAAALRKLEHEDEMAFRQKTLEATVADRASDDAFRKQQLAQTALLAKRADDMQRELHNLRTTGESDKEQQTEYGKVRQFVVAMKRQYGEQLKAGQVTPQQIREDLSDRVLASDLSGKYRDAAVAFIESQIEPILMQFEYENQGPSQQQFTTKSVYKQGP